MLPAWVTKTVFLNKIYLSYHLSKLCSLLFISFLLFIQFRSISASAPLFQYRYQRSIAFYIMQYWPSLSLDAVYWPSFFAFLWTHDANVQNLDQTRLICKGMYKIGQKRTFSRGTLFLMRKMPSGYDRPILPARVANQNKGIASYCPLVDSAIYIIKLPIITSFRPGTCGSTLRFFSVSVLPSDKFLAPWHDLNNGEKDLYSGAR